jgi:alpha-glucosidase
MIKSFFIKNIGVISFLLLLSQSLVGQIQKKDHKIFTTADEKVWAGVINEGHLMPFSVEYSMNFFGDNRSNQSQPLVLTNRGQYIWSNSPYFLHIKGNEITVAHRYDQVATGKQGNSLAEVQRYVRKKYFPASGKMPDTLLFSMKNSCTVVTDPLI